ncbi:GntR family transcriptional regulator [Roseomonas haemaphysalidis]|jgi:GntR family transcriptional regulator|uniref:GntR family transcriptional regulator n=1 Tax=Roseomonas haemaphysalidis TaxID=2768162 RepID=A0ABS3KLM7_9PROT|nr:GntR family transcriptional regulator [Roseomonas haemaphysalidis]MBO1078373.1 GntR family transcriptional regulator [Roseomonas haemaphysalidis]
MDPTNPTTLRPAGLPGAKVDLNRSAVSRYIQLATLFRRRIEQGTWKPGQQIPTVDELAAECGVARATIRQALGQLQQDGLIDRFRAKGTFVRQNAGPPIWYTVETDWTGLLRSREGAEIEILSDTGGLAGSAIPESIGQPAPFYRHIRRRHWRDGRPFLLADVYLDERLYAQVSQEDLRSKTALRLVAGLEGMKVVDARQTLTIGTADVETAAALQVPLNAPVALVHRAAVGADGVLALVADGIYRGDTVRIDIKLR